MYDMYDIVFSLITNKLEYLETFTYDKIKDNACNIYEECIIRNCDKVIPILYNLLCDTDEFILLDHYKSWINSLKYCSYEIIIFLHNKKEYKNNSIRLSTIYHHIHNNPDNNNIIKNLLLQQINDKDMAGYNFITSFISDDFNITLKIYNKYKTVITEKSYYNALLWICRKKSIKEFKWVLHNAKILNKNIELTEELLIETCIYGKLSITQFLLDRNIKLQNNDTIRKCMLKAIENKHKHILKYLSNFIPITKSMFCYACENGCFYNYKKISNKQAIELFRTCVKKNYLDIVKMLVNKYPKCVVNDPQIHYDCRISYEMKKYIKTLLNIKFNKIQCNESISTLYVNKTFYHSYILPSFDSNFWNNLPYIIIEIPKNATCSITNSINRVNCFGHMLSKSFPEHVRHKMKTICRNPYDRLVSAYFFVVKGGFGNPIEYSSLFIAYPTFESFVLNYLTKENIKFNSNNKKMEPFFAQYEYVTKDNILLLDKENIGRFENLKDDCKRLFDIDLSLHHNKTIHEPWTEYYKNQLVIDKVYELYYEDFILFDYPKNILE